MKWTAILAVFLVALTPFALAEETGTNSTQENTQTDTQNTEPTPAQKVKDARMKYLEAKDVRGDVRAMRLNTRQAIIGERQKIAAIADELRDCKQKNDDSCKQKRTDAKVTVKETLTNAADHVLKLLEDAKNRVMESELQAKEEIASSLEAQVAKIEEAKSKVLALTEESTREDYKIAVEALRTSINEARKDLAYGAHSLVSKRMGVVLEMADKLEDRLENAISKLNEKGVDTSSIDTSTFEQKVDEAEKLHSEAVDLYAKAKAATGQERVDLVKSANEKLRQAHAALKESHMILKEIAAKLKSLNMENKAP